MAAFGAGGTPPVHDRWQSSPPRRLALGLVVASLALAGVGATLWLTPWQVMLIILTILLLAPPLFDLVYGRLDPFEGRNIFLGIYFFSFVAAAVYSLEFHHLFVPAAELNAWMATALGLGVLGLLCFYVGYYLPAGPWLAASAPPLRPSWSSRRVALLAAAYIPVGLGARVVLLERAGGVLQYVTRLTSVGRLEVGSYYLAILSSRLPLTGSLACYLWGRASGRRLWEAIGLLLLLGIILGDVLMGIRGPLVMDAVMLAAGAYYVRPPARRAGRLFKVAGFALIGGLVALLVGAQTVLRTTGVRGVLSGARVLSEVARQEKKSGVGGTVELLFERSIMMEALVRVVDRTGSSVPPEAGRTLLDLLYGPIPRAFWPEKPFPWAARLGRAFLGRDTDSLGEHWAPNPTLVGELYWDGLLPGVIVGMSLWGIVVRFFYDYFMPRRNLSGALLHVTMILFFYMLGQEGTDGAVLTLASCLGPAALAYFVLRAGPGADAADVDSAGPWTALSPSGAREGAS